MSVTENDQNSNRMSVNSTAANGEGGINEELRMSPDMNFITF